MDFQKCVGTLNLVLIHTGKYNMNFKNMYRQYEVSNSESPGREGKVETWGILGLSNMRHEI